MMKLSRSLRPALASFALLSLAPLLIINVASESHSQIRSGIERDRKPLAGEKAVESLKRSGQYDSLMDAFQRASRIKTSENYASGLATSMFPEQQILGSSDGSGNDRFGIGVAVDGNTAAVGAYLKTVTANAQGAVYVFTRSGSTWTEQQRLTASDAGVGDVLGKSVSIDGDTLVVGAYQKTIGAISSQGAAYVFTRSGTTWTQQQRLTASDGAANDAFGFSVSVDGNTAVVGAQFKAVGGNSTQGAAYVFTRSGTTWTQQQKLTASDGAASDRFGISVSNSADTLIVGANLKNGAQGAAYVFTRSGTTWTQQQKLTASDGAGNDQFGISVSVDANTAVIGAYNKTIGSNGGQGAAYVFTRSGTTWSEQQQLVATGGAINDLFGWSVAVDVDTVAIGGYNGRVNGQNGRGQGWVFTRSGTTWTQQENIIASDGAAFDQFGTSIGVSGATVISGAPWKSGAQGGAYIYSAGTTAGGAHISGRVLTPEGRGLVNAMVTVTDSKGTERTAQTGTFGNFAVENLPSGESYVVSVRSRKYQFASQVVQLQADLDGFTIQASGGRR